MSVLGSPIQKFVKKQIEKRQEVHGSGIDSNRSLEEITYLNSKNSWCRLASSVYINDDADGEDRLKKIGLSKSNVGSKLAKEWILFNGTGDGKKAGINGLNPNPAYGLKNTDQGYVPMPGIKDFNVECLNRGSLKKITLNLVCFNAQQLSIIDVLYLRLGYTVFLEWGWDKYFKNGSSTLTSNDINLTNSFLGNSKQATTSSPFKSAEDKLRNDIFKKRSNSNGNYDAIIARIVNFNWSFTKDGNYEISLELLSKGDIMESLKINQPPAIGGDIFEPLSVAWDKIWDNPSGLSTFLSTLGSTLRNLFNNWEKIGFLAMTRGANRFETHMNEIRYFLSEAQDTGWVGDEKRLIVAASIQAHRARTTLGRRQGKQGISLLQPGDIYPLGYSLYPEFRNRPSSYFVKYAKDNFSWYPNNWSNGIYPVDYAMINKGGNGLYMRLGAFLNFVEEVCIPKADGGVPLLRIWYKDDDDISLGVAGRKVRNPIYSMGDIQLSLDPRVCIIANYNFISEPAPASNQNKSLFGGWNKTSGNYKPQDFGLEQFHKKVNGIQTGRLMNVYLSCEYIASTLFGGKDFKGDIFLGKMLEKMCNDVSTALGGVNKLEVIIDEEINTIQIIDQATIPNKEKIFDKWYEPAINAEGEEKVGDESDYTLELVGYNEGKKSSNFVRNLSLSTGITPEYANMISIGATAGGYRPGEESSAFSKWNKGLTDRYHLVTYDAQLSTPPAPTTTFESLYKETTEEYDRYLKSRWKIIGVENVEGEVTEESDPTALSEDIINKNLDLVTDYYTYLHASSSQATNSPSNQTGFLPFNMSIDLDGISGFKIYNKLEIDTEFLPSNYPDSLDFIITKVNSTVSDNDWTTTLDTMCIAKSKPTSFTVTSRAASTTTSATTTTSTSSAFIRYPLRSVKSFELTTINVRMKLMRILDDGLQTLGILQVYAEDGVTKLYDLKTVELPFKGNKNNISCVPPGKYLIRAGYDGGYKYGYYMGLKGNNLSSDPYKSIPSGGSASTRSGVLIHRGSSSVGLAGCISPGSAFATNTAAKLVTAGQYQEFDPAARVGNLAGNPRGVKNTADSIKQMDKLAQTFYVNGDADIMRQTSWFLEIFDNPAGLLTTGGNASAVNNITFP